MKSTAIVGVDQSPTMLVYRGIAENVGWNEEVVQIIHNK